MAYTDSVSKVLEILKDNFGAGFFKMYFEGDPVLVGESSLPAICVSKQSSSYSVNNAPTQFDRVTELLTIKLMLNKKDDFNASATTDMTEKKLRVLAEGHDEAGALLGESVIGALRTKFTSVGTMVLDQDISIDYGVVPRPDEVITAEAHINITITSLQQITGRT
jgi:hypothetical protein